MEKVILHIDANCFYASVELAWHPEYTNMPVAVCGDPEVRHGIVLTANYLAKAKGVKTAMAIWEAKQCCPDLHIFSPSYDLYLAYSHKMRAIFEDYTNKVENYGLDEHWLDLSQEGIDITKGAAIADEIRQRVKHELGITVSIGVSFTKPFSKLGSDMKKPDAITVIPKDKYKQIVWPQPVGNLLFAGAKTSEKLVREGIYTIGDLARASESKLHRILGKNGRSLQLFALGEDGIPVKESVAESAAKSIGNSSTLPHDIANWDDACAAIYMLSDSVTARLRSHGLKANTVSLSCRSGDMGWLARQYTFKESTYSCQEIAKTCLQLFREKFMHLMPLRTIGVLCSSLTPANQCAQIDLFGEQQRKEKDERVLSTVDDIRRRFGSASIQIARVAADEQIAQINPKDNHFAVPTPFYSGK